MAEEFSADSLCGRLPGVWNCYRSEFSGGVLLEIFPQAVAGSAAAAAQMCSSYILLPAENTWPLVLRAILYFAFLFYFFVGFASITASFMTAMELIVSKTKTVTEWDSAEGREVTKEIKIWNPAIADITLLALGTCAPQIALALINAIQLLGKDQSQGLGPGTIVGGAAFNFFPILATIVLVPKAGTVKCIEGYGVFVVELVWSLWAYFWVLLVIQIVTPNQVTLWEAIVTVLQMPILVFHAYGTDQGWFKLPFSRKSRPQAEGQAEAAAEEGRAASSWSNLPRIPSASKLVHRWRKNYARYRIQATTSLTAERRPSASRRDSVTRKLRRRFLSGLSLRKRSGTGRSNGDLSEGHGGGKESRLNGRELETIKEDLSMTREPPQSSELDEYLHSTGITRIDSDDDLTSLDGTPREPGPTPQHETSALNVLPPEILKDTSWSTIRRLWKQQLIDAMSVKGAVDDKGQEMLPSTLDFIMHPIVFPWKTLFAVIVPPAPLGGGWVAFMTAIGCITGMAAVVIELANLFGCVSGADSFVIALTLLASGTSFPDLIASYIAADHEETADSAVANINASNSITVFLGLGLPWMLSVLYYKLKLKQEYQQPAGNLAFTLFIYFGAMAIGVILLVSRRRFLGGEIGGRRSLALVSSVIFGTLWFLFLLLASLKAYHYF